MELAANHSFRYRDGVVRFVRVGQGPPLMFLHNAGTSHIIWRHLIEHFRATHEVIGLDLPGFGASSPPVSGYSLPQHIELIGELVAQLGLSPVVLIGNCMGSAISLLYAAASPHTVSALALFNPLSLATFRAGELRLLRSVERFAPASMDALTSLMTRVYMPAGAAAMTIGAQLGRAGRLAGLESDPDLQACYRRLEQLPALRRLLSEIDDFAAVDRLVVGRGFPPRCTIWGQQNRILSPAAGRVLNQRLQPSRAEQLAECGHLPMLEQPTRCIAIVRQFLEAPTRQEDAHAS